MHAFTAPNLKRLARLAFWVALGLVLIFTLGPVTPSVVAVDDKLQHFLGFFALAALGLAGWGRRRAFILSVALAGLGGVIELLQGTELIGRDADLADWVANLAGISLAVAPAIIVRRAGQKTQAHSD